MRGFPAGVKSSARRVERLAGAPRVEARCREHAVEAKGQLLSLARREERLEVEHADAVE